MAAQQGVLRDRMDAIAKKHGHNAVATSDRLPSDVFRDQVYVTFQEDVVGYTDLVIDVLLRPSGETIVLDEEELPPDLAPSQRRHSRPRHQSCARKSSSSAAG